MRNYSDPQYKDWRKKIYSSDHYTCRWPGCTKKKSLQAHHIYKWSEYPGLRFHPDNGITLCRQHHEFIKNNEDGYINFFQKLILERKKT